MMCKKQKKKPQASYLMQGMESKEMIDCLLSVTKIDSERKIGALHYHFVDGANISNAAAAHNLPQPNLTDAIETLNKVAEACEKYHELKMHSKIYTS